MLRCPRHVEANCREVLKKTGVPSSAEEIMIDIVFGESRLIETGDKKGLNERLKESIVLLSDLKRKSMNLEEEDGKDKFAVYIEEREQTILRKVIRSVRRKTFRTPESTIPPRLYTNQSETVNSVLSAKKQLRDTKRRKIFQSLILSKRFYHRRSAISVVKLKEHSLAKVTNIARIKRLNTCKFHWKHELIYR